MPRPVPRLKQFDFLVRVGLTGIILVLLIGFAASMKHLVDHHENRDGAEGMSVDDVKGAYVGLNAEAPLLTSLRSGHPDGLPEDARAILEEWLTGDRISEDYDSIDLGDFAPEFVIIENCASCHSRNSDDELAREIPLEYWDDIEKLAFGRDVSRTPPEILAMSTHTHALSLGVVGIAIGVLATMTRWPRLLVSPVIAITGLGLFADIAGWWVVRDDMGMPGLTSLFPLILVGGAAFSGGCILLQAMILIDMWLPGGRGPSATGDDD